MTILQKFERFWILFALPFVFVAVGPAKTQLHLLMSPPTKKSTWHFKLKVQPELEAPHSPSRARSHVDRFGLHGFSADRGTSWLQDYFFFFARSICCLSGLRELASFPHEDVLERPSEIFQNRIDLSISHLKSRLIRCKLISFVELYKVLVLLQDFILKDFP